MEQPTNLTDLQELVARILVDKFTSNQLDRISDWTHEDWVRILERTAEIEDERS